MYIHLPTHVPHNSKAELRNQMRNLSPPQKSINGDFLNLCFFSLESPYGDIYIYRLLSQTSFPPKKNLPKKPLPPRPSQASQSTQSTVPSAEPAAVVVSPPTASAPREAAPPKEEVVEKAPAPETIMSAATASPLSRRRWWGWDEGNNWCLEGDEKKKWVFLYSVFRSHAMLGVWIYDYIIYSECTISFRILLREFTSPITHRHTQAALQCWKFVDPFMSRKPPELFMV